LMFARNNEENRKNKLNDTRDNNYEW
jgi:hypothetical protein